MPWLQVDLTKATNILDRWIAAATRRLTAFVRTEMDAYRLYTVVPDLVRFIESLTNIYVRYNRARLKGRLGAADCSFALASLFDVLLTVSKVGCWASLMRPGSCPSSSGLISALLHASSNALRVHLRTLLMSCRGVFAC